MVEVMSADGEIRVGVVGLNIGRVHVSEYGRLPGVRVAAVCDTDADRRGQVAAEHGIPHAFAEVGELFASGQVDAVSLCTPNASHAPLAMEAMRRGLHVLVEKPMAMNTIEARQMLAVSRETDRRLGVNFNHRMQPHVQALRRLIDAGELGELYFGRTTWHRRQGIPTRPSFVTRQHAGGGAMIDLGVHQLDQLLFLMGHPRIRSLSAQVYTKFAGLDVPDLAMDVDDFAVAFIRFENGATAQMEISWAGHHHIDEHRILQVYGTHAGARRELIRYSGGPNDLTIYRRRDGALTEEVVHDPPPATSVQADFVDAIRTGRDPACSANHGLTTMMILDALYESSRTGREVDFAAHFA